VIQKLGIAYLVGLMTALTIHDGMAHIVGIRGLVPVSATAKTLPGASRNRFFDVRTGHIPLGEVEAREVEV
jgi:hypothetical protein